jgi:formylglycine-generating enzyme required for sulfatase activity
MKLNRSLLVFGLLWLAGLNVLANNLQFRQLSWQGTDRISLELSWEHSWRLDSSAAPGNYDAVWIFAKYRTATSGWQHLDFSALNQAHQISDPGLMVKAAPDEKGLMVQRAVTGSGDIPWTLLEIQLATPLTPGQYALQVLGIEMVWVNEGAFFLGDSASFHHFREWGSGAPFRVEGEQSIVVDSLPGALFDSGEKTPAGDIPAAYPKGYAGFYLMKYEISQEQYRDFLNSLSFAQQEGRTRTSPMSMPGSYALAASGSFPQRNGLIIDQPGSPAGQPAAYSCEANADGQRNNLDDGQNRACNFLSWEDLTAYLDWAGLRPMTELEFEKACRGPVYPVPREFAWGTDSVIDANTLLLDGRAGETVTEQANDRGGLASHGYAGPDGPLRGGFGAHDASGRLQAGAGYFGALELSGNLWELCVGLGETGLLFAGQHGDGTLDSQGRANVNGWPGPNGAAHRGGALNSGIIGGFRDLAVSDRFYVDLPPVLRRNTSGGRGVRSAW